MRDTQTPIVAIGFHAKERKRKGARTRRRKGLKKKSIFAFQLATPTDFIRTNLDYAITGRAGRPTCRATQAELVTSLILSQSVNRTVLANDYWGEDEAT